MKGKVVISLVSLALLFITMSCTQAASIDPANVNNPPTAPSVPSGPTSGTSGVLSYYTYTTMATDPDGDRVQYTFDWGDGTTSTVPLVNQGVTVSAYHKWTVSGSTKTFSVRAQATDSHRADSSWSNPLSVTITDPTAEVTGAASNNPPATPSVPSGSTSGSSGTSYSYSTKATDPDGDKVQYTFDWGDGTTSTTSLVSSGASSSASHKWTVSSGSTKTFSVRAKATDDNGTDSSWSSSLSVTITGPAASNNPPATPSVPSGSTSGSSGTSYSYSTKATDPDGDKVQYTFDWGDGTTSTTSLVSSGASSSASHKWTVSSGSTKTFSVRAKATDDNGTDSSWSSSLSVTITGPAAANNPPATPSVPSGSTSGSSGTSYSYSTKATDPDGDKVQYTFDWGDGTTSTTSLVSSGASSSASHKWTVSSGSTKTFSVRAKATDDNGTDSSWSSSLSVTITGPAAGNSPPATPSIPQGDTSGPSGIYYSYSTKATDPDGDKVRYTFDWGDGTTSTTSLISSGTKINVFHKWEVALGSTKTFSVRAKAADDSGAESSWSSPLSVTITGQLSGSNNPPATPSIPSGITAGDSGKTYSYVTKATDPDGDKVKYTFDWGDGTTSTTSLVSSGASASASHSWTIAPGTTKTFSLSVKATDERGADSGWTNPLPIMVLAGKEQRPPTIPSKPSGPTSGISGVSYTYSTSSTDPDGDMIKYIFDWGDGSTETGYFPSGQVVTATHSWTVPAGSTRSYKVCALSVDGRVMMCPPPYWSDPLVVTIAGPSISAQKLSSQAEVEEAIYAQTEEVVLGSTSNDFNYSSIDAQNEENESVDAQTEDAEYADAQTEDAEYADAQTEDAEYADAQTEDAEYADAQTEDAEYADAQTEEDEYEDAQAEEDCNFAADDEYSMASTGNELRISAPGVLENDQCGNDKSLSVMSHSQPAHATDFAMNSDGSFTYTRSQDYCGEDSFTYTIDGDCESNEATVTIFIDCDPQNEGDGSLSSTPA